MYILKPELTENQEKKKQKQKKQKKKITFHHSEADRGL